MVYIFYRDNQEFQVKFLHSIAEFFWLDENFPTPRTAYKF